MEQTLFYNKNNLFKIYECKGIHFYSSLFISNAVNQSMFNALTDSIVNSDISDTLFIVQYVYCKHLADKHIYTVSYSFEYVFNMSAPLESYGPKASTMKLYK